MKIQNKLRTVRFFWVLCLLPVASLEECGISLSKSRRQPRSVIAWTGRIISGQESPKGAWPWQSECSRTPSKNKFWICPWNIHNVYEDTDIAVTVTVEESFIGYTIVENSTEETFTSQVTRISRQSLTQSLFQACTQILQVSLELLHPKHGYIGHWCGGVLIYSQWVLTAAHCIHNDLFSLPLPALWTAVLGEWDREVNEETEIRVPVEKIFVHERFHNYQHDIALLKLSRIINTEENHIGTVCLPKPGVAFPTSLLCMATGWGHSRVKGSLVARLLEARIPLHKNSVCQAKYGIWVAIRAGHLCAGQTDGSTGTCVGDSGGPLQCKQDGRWFLAGITSFGSGCAKPGYPDVYTRLSFYLPWITKKINSTSSAAH